MIRKKLFENIDEVFRRYEFNISDADRFALLLHYQAKYLTNISNNNNERTRAALARTSMYELGEVLKRWKKNKSKNQLFKLVNMFAITCEEYAVDSWSCLEIVVWGVIVSQKDIIVNNKDWYLRVIPESKWLIEKLED